MKRLGLLALILAAMLSQASGQQPQTPPVEVPPVIAPPVMVKPDSDEPVVPTPDPLTKPFAIVATSRGAVLGELIAKPEVGHLLKLTLEGLPESADPVFWTYSEVIPDRDERDAGKWVGLSFPPESAGKAYLVQAAVNAEAGKPPLVAMRWLVVSGNGPQPPPPNVIVPPKPIPHPVTAGSKRIVVIRESLEPSPEMGRLIVLMQSGPIGDYMAAKGHKFESFDKDAKDENGQPSAYVKKWLDAIGTTEIPTAVIVDIATETIDAIRPLGKEPTAKALLDIAKEYGG